MKLLKILLVSIMILGGVPVALVTTSVPVEAQSFGWEELGKVTGYTIYKTPMGIDTGSSVSGILYVKTSGYSSYYKIKIGSSFYSISASNKWKGYNAQFTYNSTTYYLSI